jgi:transposase
LRGLNKLYYIKKEIEEIKLEIKNLPEIGAGQITGMPHSNDVSDPIFNLMLKKDRLVEKLNRKIERYMEELERIEGIIEQIDDDDIRLMARMRFIRCMKWEDIGEQVHLDRTVCSKKVRKYLANMDKLPTKSHTQVL